MYSCNGKLYRMARMDIVSTLKPFLQTEVVNLADKNTVLKALSLRVNKIIICRLLNNREKLEYW